MYLVSLFVSFVYHDVHPVTQGDVRNSIYYYIILY